MIKIAIFSAKSFEKEFFDKANQQFNFDLHYIEHPLNVNTVILAKDCDAVCCFVTDDINGTVITQLKFLNIKCIALRSAGYDHVDINTAKKLGIPVVRVPSYSPNAIAEFSVGLILSLSRKIIRANDRVRLHDFSLDGQLGFNLYQKTIGIIGTGNIGSVFANIMAGFGCNLIASDPNPNQELEKTGLRYVEKEELFKQSDIISLHCDLNDNTKHIINKKSLELVKPHVLIINTGRGPLINTKDIIEYLKQDKIGGLGLDVYEFEKPLFFADHSNEIIKDEMFLSLQAFPNVLITGHQAYLSQEALQNIALTTLNNLKAALFESAE